MQLTGRVALVTGGSRGIGRGIAAALAAEGAAVALTYRRDHEAAHAAVDAIRAAGGVATCHRASVDVTSEIDHMVAEVRATVGPIDILVSNAGVASRGLSVLDTDPEELVRLIATHALSAHRLAQLVVPDMRANGRGDVVVISSSEVSHMRANGAPYNMAKAAAEALAFTLAHEESRHGIRVNVVAPGVVVTPAYKSELKLSDDLIEAYSKEVSATTPLGRVGDADEIAKAVSFLASDDASYITGTELFVDGGLAQV